MQVDVDQLDNNEVLDLLDKLEAEAEKRELTFRRRYYQNAYHEEQLRKSVAKHKAEAFLEAVEHWGFLVEKVPDEKLAIELLNMYSNNFEFAVKADLDKAKEIALELHRVLILLKVNKSEFELKFDKAMRQCEKWKKQT